MQLPWNFTSPAPRALWLAALLCAFGTAQAQSSPPPPPPPSGTTTAPSTGHTSTGPTSTGPTSTGPEYCRVPNRRVLSYCRGTTSVVLCQAGRSQPPMSCPAGQRCLQATSSSTPPVTQATCGA